MKKLLCMLLVLVMCFSCLVGCLDGNSSEAGGENNGSENGGEAGGETGGGNGGVSNEPLTAASLASRVNATIERINAFDPSNVDAEDLLEKLDLSAIAEKLTELEAQVAVRTERADGSTESVTAIKNGLLYSPAQGTYGYDSFLTIAGGALVSLVYAEQDGQTYANASYLVLSAMLDSLQTEQDLEAPADLLAGITLSLPLITEEDFTVNGETFTVRNSYVAAVASALLDSLPREAFPDESTLASIKTMLPGLIENLGLRISLQIKGAAIVGFSLSFDANDDFRAMFGIPSTTTLKGGLAVAMTDDGSGLRSLLLELEIGDLIDLTFSTNATYANGKTQTLTLELTGNLADILLGSDYDYRYDVATDEHIDIEYTVMGDLTFNVNITVNPQALLVGASPSLRFINGQIFMEASNAVLYVDGVPLTGTPDSIGGELLASCEGDARITISSDQTGVSETTITIESDVPGEEEDTRFVITIIAGSAPAFKELPEALAPLLNAAYADLYGELLAAVKATAYTGRFYFLTEEGYTLAFYYYGEGAEPSFGVNATAESDPYSHQITAVAGGYTVLPAEGGNGFSPDWSDGEGAVD